jgi:hypothetical protein
MPSMLKGAIFCGHLVTDMVRVSPYTLKIVRMSCISPCHRVLLVDDDSFFFVLIQKDSIAGAIGAADLYGGTACRASEVQFTLRRIVCLLAIPRPSLSSGYRV